MVDSKELIELDEEELHFIEKYGKCPDCKKGNLLKASKDGSSINVECLNVDCDSEFNLSFAGNSVFRGERI